MERRAIRLQDIYNMSLPILLVVLTSDLKGLRIEFEPGKHLNEGDACPLPNNASGVCTRFDACPGIEQKINQNESPVICSFDKFLSFVCCPLDLIIESASQALVNSEPLDVRQPTTQVPVLTPAPGQETGLRVLTKSERACRQNYDVLLRVRDSSLPGLCDEVYYEGPGVVGGEDAFPREFPHMVALGRGSGNNVEWKCGGSLISNRYVLTAAHCAIPSMNVVRVGDLDVNTTSDDARPQQFSVAEMIKHPDYKPPAVYNDIALFRLDRDAQFDKYVRPACLNMQDDLTDNVGEATGWGLVKSYGPASSILQKAMLPVQPGEECEKSWHSSKGTKELPRGYDDTTMLCVGDRQGEVDTCNGDSGGPYHLQKDPKECLHYVAGITSFGKSVCGAVSSPAVYTRVSRFVPWIESIVWP